MDREVDVCRGHYNGTVPLPDDAPPLGPVVDARDNGGCDYCTSEADEA